MNDMADPQTIKNVNVLSQKNDEALNTNDAAALGAIYTEDAVL
jgi:ketosteroid isomerase-like protein